MNFIQVKTSNGEEALVNLSTVTCILQNSNGTLTMYFDNEEHINIKESYNKICSTIETIQRRNNR